VLDLLVSKKDVQEFPQILSENTEEDEQNQENKDL